MKTIDGVTVDVYQAFAPAFEAQICVAGFVDTECAAVRAPGQASGGIGAEIADGTVFHRIVEVRGIFKIIHLPVRVRRCGGRACLCIYRRRISVRSHAGRLQSV